VDLKLCFTLENDGEIQGDEVIYEATFLEASKEVDAILSYAWLLQKKLCIPPTTEPWLWMNKI
jgi:hypothetical protein